MNGRGASLGRRAAALIAVVAPGLACLAATPAAPIRLREAPLLFADESGIASREGVVRTFHPARTRPAPVLTADRPWEGVRVYLYGSVLRDDAAGGFRMWYLARPEGERAGGGSSGNVPSLRAGGFDLVLTATSADGLHWTKPALGLHAFAGSRDNNIVFDLHSPSVLRDPFETDPGRRYKMIGALQGNYHAACSPDGIHWRSEPAAPILAHADTITLAQDPTTGEFLAYHKRPATVRGHPRRVVWLARSRDFRAWSEPELVLAPDAEDDAWVSRPDERTEIYNMSVFPHAAGYLGFPTIFRVQKIRARAELAPGQSPVDGPIDVQLATSRDGRAWQRTSPRANLLPRGAPGTFDGGAILGLASHPVHAGAETWIYYTAINTGHGAPMPPKQISIGRAEWRRHGFASLDAGPEGGRVETRPLHVPTGTLVVNADASRGQLRIALRESDGRAIEGCGLEQSEVLRGDATGWSARWTSGHGVPIDRAVRVVIEMTDTRLFSLAAAPRPDPRDRLE